MIQITREQINKRWDALSIYLREVLCLPEKGEIILDICRSNHLSDEKLSKVLELCGYVIMGFLHPEDLAKEIKETVGLNPEIAKNIAQEIERKIFSPIKSEIDKAYALPISSEAEEIEEAEGGEITEPVVTDIRRETGGVKITREVKYAQPAEVEPMRIIASGGEEKLVIPGAEINAEQTRKDAELPRESALSPRESALPEGPVVLHEEEEIRPILEETKKKSLGELFGFLNGKEGAVKKETASVAGEIETNKLDITNETNEIDRVVHYDPALSTPFEADKLISLKAEKPIEVEKPEKKESKPRLFFKNILQAMKPTVKVVDFTQTQTDAEQTQTNAENEIDKVSKINGTNKTDEANEINATDEAPKMIAEEPKEVAIEIKEAPVEKKKGFFARLFKRKSDDKINEVDEINETNETNEINEANEANKTNVIN